MDSTVYLSSEYAKTVEKMAMAPIHNGGMKMNEDDVALKSLAKNPSVQKLAKCPEDILYQLRPEEQHIIRACRLAIKLADKGDHE